MRKTATLVSALALIITAITVPSVRTYANSATTETSNPTTPVSTLTPDTQNPIREETMVPASEPAVAASAPDYPMRLIIPSISLNDSIVDVGVTAQGDMDVPSGSTKNVGWYKDGTVPGEQGSAVLDAHVFAAFSELHDVAAGSDVYVLTQSGKTLHFIVEESDYYALKDVPLQTLFNRDDTARLNLITCAGNLTPDHSTYDHRLIVYTKLVP